ncbi:PQ loop repeat-domain-containing protein [Phakopsora pachyrhizi]|nr:PQ loop repeat-domain-containing protein [Phakopsora pachyrhizi]
MNWFEIFSILLGWSYTLCWGISFYPQVLLNFKRKSLSSILIFLKKKSIISFLNVLGFICYSISTSALLFSKTVRKEYSDQLKTPNVRFNDLVFSLHALILSLITWYQSLIYKRDSNQRVSTITKRLILLISLFLALQLFVTINSESSREDYPSRYNYLNLIRSVSSVKALISIIKYLPQLNMNFKRKSTIGWSIGNIILDLLGGILSLFQMVLDSGLAHDWSSLTSNPGKLGISLVSIGFDFLFMIQHYLPSYF